MGLRNLAPVLAFVLVSGFFDGSAARAQGDAQAAADAEGQAREAFSRGRIHYDNGEFAQAAEAFEDAYRLSGREMLQYNLYLAYRDANMPEKAAGALRAYLERVDVIENRPQLEARLRALEEGIAERKAARERAAQEARSTSSTPSSTPPPSEQPAAQDPGKWWLMPTIVMAGGAAMMLGAIGTGVVAASKQKELDENCDGNVCDPKYEDTADQGQLFAITTDVLLFGGIAVAATGATLLLLRKPKKGTSGEADRGPTASAGCFADGCAGSVTLHF
jgi:tetratricopeptide (TPR) repeat protein